MKKWKKLLFLNVIIICHFLLQRKMNILSVRYSIRPRHDKTEYSLRMLHVWLKIVSRETPVNFFYFFAPVISGYSFFEIITITLNCYYIFNLIFFLFFS